MEIREAQRLKKGVSEKRKKLLEWVEATPPEEKEVHLGCTSQEAVQDHIHVLDDVLQKVDGGVFGICKVCGEEVDEELLEMDYTAEVCLSHLSPDELSHLERELELSRMVQMSLLPQSIPNIPGMDLAAFIRPAQIIGGDFFDFPRFKDGKYGILIADVVGKGVSASLIMASIQTVLRTLVPESESPSEVLDRINHLYAHNVNFSTFVTLFLAAYDPSTKELTYTSAGHNPPLRLRGGELFPLNPNGPALGLLESPSFIDDTISLEQGDLVLFYTDGIPEAFDEREEQYGMDRLEAFLCRNETARPKVLIQELQRELVEFTGSHPQSDDITMIASKISG